MLNIKKRQELANHIFGIGSIKQSVTNPNSPRIMSIGKQKFGEGKSNESDENALLEDVEINEVNIDIKNDKRN